MPNNRCVNCQESLCACDLEAPCPHGVPRLFLGECKPCSDAQHEEHLRAEGWCRASERDEAYACLEAIAVYCHGAGPGNGLEQGDTLRARHFALGRSLLRLMRYNPKGVVPADLVAKAHVDAAASSNSTHALSTASPLKDPNVLPPT